MRADGFGGSVMRITKGAIQYSSTTDMLERMWNEQPVQSPPESGGHETRGRLESIAASAGWDSFTLLLLISRWLDHHRQTKSLAVYLDGLASAEGE